MSRFEGLKLSIGDLIEFSNGGDQQATQILQNIEQYSTRKQQEVTNKIKQKVQVATSILAVPSLVANRDIAPWEQLRDICEDVIDIISPVDSEEVE